MFRKPRTQAFDTDGSISPPIGRPPTPPLFKSKPVPSFAETARNMAAVRQKSNKTQTTLASSFAKAQPRSKSSSNGNILSFFKKVDRGEESLFLDNITPIKQERSPRKSTTIFTQPDDWVDQDTSRFNESGNAVKRRRLDAGTQGSTIGHETQDTATHTSDTDRKEGVFFTPEEDGNQSKGARKLSGGPFVEDSDSENDGALENITGVDSCPEKVDTAETVDVVLKQEDSEANLAGAGSTVIPSLKRESTSIAYNDLDEFEGFGDIADDEFPEEGEEYMERRWMEEQRQLELEFEKGEEGVEGDEEIVGMGKEPETTEQEAQCSCPICGIDLGGRSPEMVSLHVNECLDGKSSSVRYKDTAVPITPTPNGPTPKRFQRAAIARPAQPDPFASNAAPNGSSAFSKIMSSHAEDAAWAQAAANEVASRGKPAFKRTCPFYKILPGFFICVDAFRYGAVEGCQAYFLSHFHSDHYIGLTSSWCHGPIFCSRVTGNLVRQQLRVVSKWVVDLDFEKKTEVPGTKGVYVTMIPANHCPGSSLFLFEKVVGKGNNPKTQRVLHCGDFRACPAHVQHPLLRPNVADTISGEQRQQKLDVCYLDTTYLTPKYAFPTQESVIKACADMCVSMSKDKVDEADDWEQTKKARAGSGMAKFVRKESGDGPEGEDETNNGPQISKSGKRGRGRLLVIVGTYSIGKERICLGIARALNSKIYAPPAKQRICLALEDAELASRLTSDPLEAQVHMQMLMEIRAETLADYLTEYKPHFSRIVGFRPSGWNYRPPNSRFVESPLVQTVLHSDNWKPRYSMAELVPQRGSTREASCFGVPYSEHSSFRELTMFCCALRIDKIIPTVNIGSAKSREKMKGWIEKWGMEKKKNGLFAMADGGKEW